MFRFINRWKEYPDKSPLVFGLCINTETNVYSIALFNFEIGFYGT
jgi:hypothetical protein